jgi:hypothetical protein
MSVIAVDQRPIDVEDHSFQGHLRKALQGRSTTFSQLSLFARNIA